MIKEFNIDNHIVDELVSVLEILSLQNESVDHVVDSVRAFQTNNLVDDIRVKHIINKILFDIGLSSEYSYRWFHMIDYEYQGYQKEHNHERTEDISYILYLTTCAKGGETVFKFNDEYIAARPRKGRLLLFDSNVWHFAKPTEEKKKVAVGALVKSGG